MKEKLQAIFFDFDGVIIDSNSTKTEGFRSLFKSYGPEVVSQVVGHHKLHGGISRVEKIRHAHENILGKPLTAQELDSWAARFSQLVMKKVLEVDWIAGAKHFLDNIPENITVFVISGTPQTELRQVIDKRKINKYFDEILGSPVLKPAHIRFLLEKYALSPKNCIFVGDALTDFHAARETGLSFFGIEGEVLFPDGTTVLPDCTGLGKAVERLFFW